MSQMVSLGIVVEGDSDRDFFNFFKEKKPSWFNERGFRIAIIIRTEGRPRLIRKARRHLENLRLKGCQKVLFFIDQHKDECPPATADRLRDIAKEDDVLVCVVARALEAWFLADQEAIKRVTGQQFGDLPTDDIDQPKEILKKLFRKRIRFPTEEKMVRALCPHFSFERAAEGNKSARRFLKKLPLSTGRSNPAGQTI